MVIRAGVENLTRKDIEDLISGTERTFVEIKEMLFPTAGKITKEEKRRHKKEFSSDCASFAINGGYLLLGIRDEKKGATIIGCTHSIGEIEDFTQAVHDNCKPFLDIDVKEYRFMGKRIAIFYVHKNEESLVEVDRNVYYRTGKGKRRATPTKIYSLELSRRANEYKKQQAGEEGLAGDYALLDKKQIKDAMIGDVIKALDESGFLKTRRRSKNTKRFYDFTTQKVINGIVRTFWFYVFPESFAIGHLSASLVQRDSDFEKLLPKSYEPHVHHIGSSEKATKQRNRERERERARDELRKKHICVIVLLGKATNKVLEHLYFSQMPVRLKLTEGKYLGIGRSKKRTGIIDHTFIIEGCKSTADIDHLISLWTESVEQIIIAAEG